MTAMPTFPKGMMRLQRFAARHLRGVAINGSLALSLVAAALTSIVLTTGVAQVLATVFGNGLGNAPPSVMPDLLATHTQTLRDAQMRFENRSPFFAPRKKVTTTTTTSPTTAAATQATTVPARNVYDGPGVGWVIGDDVFFSMPAPTRTEKYLRLRVGEERNGLKVLDRDQMPGFIRVEYQGKVFDVKVFGDLGSLFEAGELQ